jgi:hypothetical protein
MAGTRASASTTVATALASVYADYDNGAAFQGSARFRRRYGDTANRVGGAGHARK